jgi:hypothetical protein
MTLQSGDGKPIPENSWGGDLDPQQAANCIECGAVIPFGKFCAAHLAAAREKNMEVHKAKLAERGEELPQAPPPEPPAHEVDMTVAMAKAQERAHAIVTPGAEVPADTTNHLKQAGPAGPNMRTVGINAGQLSQAGLNEHLPEPLVLPAAAQDRRGLHRGGDFLLSQGIMWLGELRNMAEDGKIGPESAAEILQIAAELTYALAGVLKR